MPVIRKNIPSPPGWAFALVALAAFAFFLRVYAGIWTPEYGITKFLRVGQAFDDIGTAVFRATPKFIDPYPAHRWGFDGQLYAEMALDPLLRSPELHRALDNPPYRAQRILLSWLAWLFGLGRPFWVLNAFAAMNLIFWVGYAWLAARLFRPHGWSGLAGYGVILITCGVIESMQASLTDLPSFTLMLAAIMVGGTAGAGILAFAALVRTTSLIGFIGIAELTPPWREAWRKNIVRGLIAVVPVALWVAYVLWRFRGREINFDGGNLGLPFRGMMEKLGEFSVTAVHGPIRWKKWYYELYKSYDLHAVLTIVSVVTQSIYIALHREWRSPLWRWGAVTVVYFSCITFFSWESHFTITRHALPMTLLFNLLLAARPTKAWLMWFLLGNLFVPFGVKYFDGMREFHTPAPLREFTIETTAAKKPVVGVRYAEGWTSQLWWPDTTWRWATGGSAAMILHQDSGRPVRAELRFRTLSLVERRLRVSLDNATVYEATLPAARSGVTIPLEIPPGESRLVFSVTGATTKTDDDTPGQVTFKVEMPVLQLKP